MQWKDGTKYDYNRRLLEFFGWLATSSYSHMIVNNNQLTESFSIEAFLIFCAQKKKLDKTSGQRTNLALTSMTKYSSALKYYLKLLKRPLTKEQETRISDFLKGYKRICAQEKQEGIRPIKEGKEVMKFKLYRRLAEYFYRHGDFESALYLVLCWNLACRTNNTEDIKLSHIGWHEDALKIQFGVTKANQEGDRDEWRLIFANPQDSIICPILSLAIYLSSLAHQFSPLDRLFLGGTPADRFHKALQKALKTEFLRPTLETLGLQPGDIGAHSIRKGAATYLANGSTYAPSYSSICLRLGWSLGVQGRYLHYNYAADAFCGRILAGLDHNSTSFSTLPPHPAHDIPTGLTRNAFPSTENIPTLEPVRQFMLSSLLHASDKMAEFLPQCQTVFQSYVFRNLSSLQESIPVITGISSPVLRATGLPPHVITWLYQNETRDSITALPEQISHNMSRENGVAAGNVTREMMETMIRNLLETDRQHRSPSQPHTQPEATPHTTTMFLWESDNRYHRLPESYDFPDFTVIQAFLHWFEGNKEKQIPPFRFLEMFDVPPSQKKRFSDIRCLILEMLRQLPSAEQAPLRGMATLELTAVGRRLISALPKKPKKKNTKISEWKVTTALKEVRQAKILANPSRKRMQKAPNPSSYPRPKRLRS